MGCHTVEAAEPSDMPAQPQLLSPCSNDTGGQADAVACHEDGVSGGGEMAVGEAAGSGEEHAIAVDPPSKRRRRAAAWAKRDSEGEEDGGGGEN